MAQTALTLKDWQSALRNAIDSVEDPLQKLKLIDQYRDGITRTYLNIIASNPDQPHDPVEYVNEVSKAHHYCANLEREVMNGMIRNSNVFMFDLFKRVVFSSLSGDVDLSTVDLIDKLSVAIQENVAVDISPPPPHLHSNPDNVSVSQSVNPFRSRSNTNLLPLEHNQTEPSIQMASSHSVRCVSLPFYYFFTMT